MLKARALVVVHLEGTQRVVVVDISSKQVHAPAPRPQPSAIIRACSHAWAGMMQDWSGPPPVEQSTPVRGSSSGLQCRVFTWAYSHIPPKISYHGQMLRFSRHHLHSSCWVQQCNCIKVFLVTGQMGDQRDGRAGCWQSQPTANQGLD